MPTRKGSLIVEEKGIDWTGGDARNEVFHVLYLGERPVVRRDFSFSYTYTPKVKKLQPPPLFVYSIF